MTSVGFRSVTVGEDAVLTLADERLDVPRLEHAQAGLLAQAAAAAEATAAVATAEAGGSLDEGWPGDDAALAHLAEAEGALVEGDTVMQQPTPDSSAGPRVLQQEGGHGQGGTAAAAAATDDLDEFDDSLFAGVDVDAIVAAANHTAASAATLALESDSQHSMEVSQGEESELSQSVESQGEMSLSDQNDGDRDSQQSGGSMEMIQQDDEQVQGEAADAADAVPSPATASVRYPVELAFMVEMGFGDDQERANAALLLCDGDVGRALNQYNACGGESGGTRSGIGAESRSSACAGGAFSYATKAAGAALGDNGAATNCGSGATSSRPAAAVTPTKGVYVLRLKEKRHGKPCFYVGKSDDKPRRITEHREGGRMCAAWVSHNGGVAEVLDAMCPPEEHSSWEMKETITLAIIHGFDNVRGWEWTRCTPLSADECKGLRLNAFGMGDLCRKCGNSRHFAAGCRKDKATWLVECDGVIAAAEAAVPAQPMNSADVLATAVRQRNAAPVAAGSRGRRPAPSDERPTQRARTGGAAATRRRRCESCDTDISDRPESHRVCLGCYRSGGDLSIASASHQSHRR